MKRTQKIRKCDDKRADYSSREEGGRERETDFMQIKTLPPLRVLVDERVPSFHLSSVPISNRQAKEERNGKTLQLHSTLHFHQCLIFYERKTLFEVAPVPSKGQCWIAMASWLAIRHLPATLVVRRQSKATVRLRCSENSPLGIRVGRRFAGPDSSEDRKRPQSDVPSEKGGEER